MQHPLEHCSPPTHARPPHMLSPYWSQGPTQHRAGPQVRAGTPPRWLGARCPVCSATLLTAASPDLPSCACLHWPYRPPGDFDFSPAEPHFKIGEGYLPGAELPKGSELRGHHLVAPGNTRAWSQFRCPSAVARAGGTWSWRRPDLPLPTPMWPPALREHLLPHICS